VGLRAEKLSPLQLHGFVHENADRFGHAVEPGGGDGFQRGVEAATL